MGLIKAANLALRFGLELCALAATAYWGATSGGRLGSRILLALAAPLAVATVWALFVAPKAAIHTQPLVRFLVELAVFAVAALALLRREQVALAAILGLCYAVNRALMIVWDQ